MIQSAKSMLGLAVTLVCATVSAQEINSDKTRPAKATAGQITSLAAGYCKAYAEKFGTDFSECFKSVTDTAIERLREESAKSAKNQSASAVPTSSTDATGLAESNADVVVIKDTREFDKFTSSVFGNEGCRMPKDENHVQAGECEVRRKPYVSSGEYLYRNKSSGLCTQVIYKTTARHSVSIPGGGEMIAPDVTMQSRIYNCAEDGSKVKS